MTSTRIVGSLCRAEDGKGVVRIEDLYDTDTDDLWSALTDPRRLARWIADVDGDLRLGGRIQARFTSSWAGPGRIDACEAPHHLALTLSPGASDETVIDAVLVAEQDRTRLVIEERGIPVAELAGHGRGLAGPRGGPGHPPRRSRTRRLAHSPQRFVRRGLPPPARRAAYSGSGPAPPSWTSSGRTRRRSLPPTCSPGRG